MVKPSRTLGLITRPGLEFTGRKLEALPDRKRIGYPRARYPRVPELLPSSWQNLHL